MKLLAIILTTGLIISSYAKERHWKSYYGASWPKLTDHAQIQLLIDEMRSAPPASKRYLVEAQFLQKVNRGESRPAERQNAGIDIYIDGNRAVADLKEGALIVFQKNNNRWQVIDLNSPAQQSLLRAGSETGGRNMTLGDGSGFSAGQTFINIPLSEKHHIAKLTRGVTKVHLDRTLFGTPAQTASYYHAHYRDSAPFVEATYVQFVTDPLWKRIVYGSPDRWIKAYDEVNGPTAIAVDAKGRVFVGETGKQRILVLQYLENESDGVLRYLFDIPGIMVPTAIAFDDNGSPLDIHDDILYIADAATNKILKYALEPHKALLIVEFEGFDNPSGIVVGKWNGANNDFLYVIDKTGRRIRKFVDNGSELTPLEELKGRPDQYFKGIKCDHFGNVYVAEQVYSRLIKYTAGLELLDEEGGAEVFEGLAGIDIPFGRITIEGEGTFWAGFDQLFALERWTENSGGRRQMLGLAIKNARFYSDQDVSQINSRFMMTDFGRVSVQILDDHDEVVRVLASQWMVSGEKTITWDRRDHSAVQVPGGRYRYQLTANSPYHEEPISLSATFYLPGYYWQDCGSKAREDDHYLVSGKPVRWGESPTETANEHPSRVIYRIKGLNPQSEYQVAVECYAGDGIDRHQQLRVNDEFLLQEIHVTEKAARTVFLNLPRETYRHGEVTISIENHSQTSAVVSQVWLKEVGIDFLVEPDGVTEIFPEIYALEQNYPNPFNPITTIQYRIAKDARVKLEVFNLLGQKVRMLAEGAQAAGTYTVTWDGKNDAGIPVASGIYFYRLVAESYVQTRRMLLLK